MLASFSVFRSLSISACSLIILSFTYLLSMISFWRWAFIPESFSIFLSCFLIRFRCLSLTASIVFIYVNASYKLAVSALACALISEISVLTSLTAPLNVFSIWFLVMYTLRVKTLDRTTSWNILHVSAIADMSCLKSRKRKICRRVSRFRKVKIEVYLIRWIRFAGVATFLSSWVYGYDVSISSVCISDEIYSGRF